MTRKLALLCIVAVALAHFGASAPASPVKGSPLAAFLTETGVLSPREVKAVNVAGNAIVSVTGSTLKIIAMNEGGQRKYASVLLLLVFNETFTSLQFDVNIVVFGDYKTAFFKISVIYGNKSATVLSSSEVNYRKISEDTRIYKDTLSVDFLEPVPSVYLQVNATAPGEGGDFIKLTVRNFKAMVVGEAVRAHEHVMEFKGDHTEHRIVFYNITPGTYHLGIFGTYTITSVAGGEVREFKEYVMYKGKYYKLYEILVEKTVLEIHATSPNAIAKVSVPLLTLVGEVKVEVESSIPLVSYMLCSKKECSKPATVPAGTFYLKLSKPGVYKLVINATSDFMLGYREIEFVATDISTRIEVVNERDTAIIKVWAWYAHDNSPFSGQIIFMGKNYSYVPGIVFRVKDTEVSAYSALPLVFLDAKYAFSKTVKVPVRHLDFQAEMRERGLFLSFRFTDGTVPKKFRVKIGDTWVAGENGIIILPPEYAKEIIQDAEVYAEGFVSDESGVRGTPIMATAAPALVTAGDVDPIFDPTKPKDISIALIVLRTGTYSIYLDIGGKKKLVGTYELVSGTTPSIPVTVPPLNTTSPVLIRFVAVDESGAEYVIGSLLVTPIKPEISVEVSGNTVEIRSFYVYSDPVTKEEIRKPLPHAHLVIYIGGEKREVQTDSTGVYKFKLDYSASVKIYYLGKLVFNRYIRLGRVSPFSRTEFILLIALILMAGVYGVVSRKVLESAEKRELKKALKRKALYRERPRYSWSTIFARWEHFADGTYGSRYLPLAADEALKLAVQEGFYFPRRVEERIQRTLPRNVPEEERENMYIEKAIPYFLRVLEEVGRKSREYRVVAKNVHGTWWIIPEKLLRMKSSGSEALYTIEHQLLVRKGAAIAAEAGYDVAIIDTTTINAHGQSLPAPDAIAVLRDTKVALEAETKTLWKEEDLRKVLKVLKRAYTLIDRLGVYVIIYTLDEEYEKYLQLLEKAVFTAADILPEDSPEEAVEKLYSSPATAEDVARLFGEKISPESSTLRTIRHIYFAYDEEGLHLLARGDPANPDPEILRNSKLIICPISHLFDWLIAISEKEIEEEVEKRM